MYSNNPFSMRFMNAETSFQTFTTCSNTPVSSCPMGYNSPNKVAPKEMISQWLLKSQPTEREERALMDLAIAGYLRKETSHSVMLHQKILKEYLLNLSFEIPPIWQDFLGKLINISEFSSLVQLEMGNCGESAYYSIVNSLIEQINTGNRETIQFIMFLGKSSQIGHGVALYNAQPLPSSQSFLEDNNFNFFEELKQFNENHPIIACDSWINFHGAASDWEAHFRASKDNYLANTRWTKINVEDYSIPSFRNNRNESNPEMRKLLKNLMLDILKGELDYERLRESKRKPIKK